MESAYYAVTFHLISGILNESERSIVLDMMKKEDGASCNIVAIVIMPNHVHVILSPRNETTLAKIMQRFKGATAREVNRLRGCSGSLWMKDSYDRIIRNEKDLIEKTKYLLENPLRAGLVEQPEAYKWRYAPEFQPSD